MDTPRQGREVPKNISINTLILAVKGLELDGGIDPRWLTFCQAQEKGWHVKKGAKGTHVTLWKPFVKADEQDTEDTEDEKVVVVMQRFFTVFHASQIEGID